MINFLFAIILTFGLIIRGVTVHDLGRFFHVSIKVYEDHKIIKTGFYKYLRHPMYLANILIFLGVAGTFSSILGIWATILLIIPTTILRIYREEYYLRKHFGVFYDIYSRKTYRLLYWIW